jgi:hypothetical protein
MWYVDQPAHPGDRGARSSLEVVTSEAPGEPGADRTVLALIDPDSAHEATATAAAPATVPRSRDLARLLYRIVRYYRAINVV